MVSSLRLANSHQLITQLSNSSCLQRNGCESCHKIHFDACQELEVWKEASQWLDGQAILFRERIKHTPGATVIPCNRSSFSQGGLMQSPSHVTHASPLEARFACSTGPYRLHAGCTAPPGLPTALKGAAAEQGSRHIPSMSQEP